MFNIEIKDILTSVGQVDLVTLSSKDMVVVLTTYGAAIYQIKVLGQTVSVAPSDLDDFLRSPFYYGKSVGRTAGRLVLPSYHIDDVSYPIKSYRGERVSLHGGINGFSFQHFLIKEIKKSENEASVSFFYHSKDREADYPGDLDVVITYTLSKDLKLNVTFEATSNQDTLCNLTNHTYFNLAKKESPIHEHQVQIQASHYLNIDDDNVILSKEEVTHTPFDFRKKKHLGTALKAMEKTSFLGFDHTWLFDSKQSWIDIDEPTSKVKLRVTTSYPAVVIYTHNHLSPSKLRRMEHGDIHSSFTLECQYEPGGIHHPYLNQAILRKHQKYHEFITFHFIKKQE